MRVNATFSLATRYLSYSLSSSFLALSFCLSKKQDNSHSSWRSKDLFFDVAAVDASAVAIAAEMDAVGGVVGTPAAATGSFVVVDDEKAPNGDTDDKQVN
jgi:hypothetical protein